MAQKEKIGYLLFGIFAVFILLALSISSAGVYLKTQAFPLDQVECNFPKEAQDDYLECLEEVQDRDYCYAMYLSEYDTSGTCMPPAPLPPTPSIDPPPTVDGSPTPLPPTPSIDPPPKVVP